MSTLPALEMAMQPARRSAVVKAGKYPHPRSPELEVVSPATPSLRKSARREENRVVRSDQAIWESQSIAVCRVNAAGEILRANGKFLEMIAVPEVSPGMNARDLLAQAGVSAPVETIALGAGGEQLLILVPLASEDDRSNAAFRLLHDSVAQSVAALAMNLFLVEQSGATSTSPNAEKILRASLELVEQCAKEVRGICTLLQRQSKRAGRNCA